MSKQAFKIALVAGEASSDMIGADLINSINQLNPAVKFIAVGGKRIKNTPAQVIQDNEVFSVMGLVEVLKDLPHLLKIKKQVLQQILAFKPDVFIGVDSPDLNFSLAKSLKKQDIPVIHYVSPSVWAWRPKRVHKMAQFIDCLLTLFPFEVPLYLNTSIKAEFVGHPLAMKIPVVVDKTKSKQVINGSSKKILAVLPGSRNREIKQLMPVFAQTIKNMKLSDEWHIMSCNVSEAKMAQVQAIAEQHNLNITWANDTSELLQAADFALLGSGTVALESMLCKTPMVVAYQISALTWFIVDKFNMMQLPYYSLPNVLANEFLVPEVMQNDLTVEHLQQACEQVMQATNQTDLIQRFTEIHQSLLPSEKYQAAKAVLEFMEQRC